jgi:ABC-2 type transport system ATP-binding protein
MSSHILAEVEALCDDVSIVRAGRTVQKGSLSEMRHLTRTSIVAELDVVPDDLAALGGVHAVQVDGHRVQLDVDTKQLGDLLAELTRSGVRSLVSQPPTLEELFLRNYGDEIEP